MRSAASGGSERQGFSFDAATITVTVIVRKTYPRARHSGNLDAASNATYDRNGRHSRVHSARR